MKLGKITGNVVATIKHDVYEGERLLLLHPIGPDGEIIGTGLIGVDAVQAGPGDTVLYVDEGNSARTILKNPQAPVRVVVMAIVDSIDWREK